MKTVDATLELLMAEAVSASGLGVTAPLSLQLLPGDCIVIEGTDAAQLGAFADLCSGLVPLRAGQVKCSGHDWADLPHDFAAALRGRIGRVFASGGWLSFLDAETNILLPQLHHTRRTRRELRHEAAALAREFGLPGMPEGRLDELAPIDLARAMLVRAFLGQPLLLLIEEPAVAFRPALHNRIAALRDHGGAVVWLIGARRAREARAFAASRWLRLSDRGLIAVGAAA